MLGTPVLLDRLKVGGVGSAGGDGSTGGDDDGAGDDGGVKNVTSGSVGRARGDGGNTEWSSTSGTSGAVGTVTGVAGDDAGSSGAVLAVTGGGCGCAGCDTAVGEGVGPGSVGVTEENFRKNCRFLSVTRPLPSTRILYLLYPRSSMTVPDLSHLLAILPAPCWFWTRTLWPRLSGERFLVCSLHCSRPLETDVVVGLLLKNNC